MTAPTSDRLPWPRWAEAAAVAGAWALFVSVALVGRALTVDIPFSLHTVGVSLSEYVPWLVVTPLVLALTRRFSLLSGRWPRHLALYALVGGAVVVGVGAAQAAGVRAMGPPPGLAPSAAPAEPPGPLASRPRRAEPPDPSGPPAWSPSLNVLLYLALLGVGVARAYAIHAASRREDAERARAERAEAEQERDRLAAQVAEARLAALRMQLRPHFLFNALNAVSALAGEDPTEVRRIVARLSSLLRRVLEADTRPTVPLRDELAFARDYLDLQRVRFDRLGATEDVDPNLLDAEVPTLLLQPLVENAVEHGAAQGGGHVWIGARREGDRLVLTVGDDGPGPNGAARDRQPTDGHRGVGLANTRDRLEAQTGGGASLVLREREGGGAEAVVTLPLDDA